MSNVGTYLGDRYDGAWSGCARIFSLGQPRPLFVYFHSFQTQNFQKKTICGSGIQTRIVRAEGEYADHFTATKFTFWSTPTPNDKRSVFGQRLLAWLGWINLHSIEDKVGNSIKFLIGPVQFRALPIRTAFYVSRPIQWKKQLSYSRVRHTKIFDK